MPAISIDIETTGGTRQGAGPIVSATNLKTVQRLSKAGTVSFDMPCADPKAAEVQAKRIMRPHTLRNGAVVALPAGIVDSITVRGRRADPPLLTISGDDILSELANRRVLSLEVSNGAGGPVPIGAALTAIMAFAPPGWTIDTSTFTPSTATIYKKFGNETVLAALIWVANAVGEQFRLGTDRQVVWLYHDQPPGGLRAIQTGDTVALGHNTAVVLISALEEVQDTHTTITRIYPYGAGNEAARVTLANATWTAPAGYTIDTLNNFIAYTSADTANRIEDVVTVNSIGEIGTTATDKVSASNQLAVAAYEELRRRIVAVKTYRLTVTKVDAEIRPGETISVFYRKTIDGYVAVAIDANLVILEVSTSYDRDGTASVALTVATVDAYPATTAASVVQRLASGASSESAIVQTAARARTAETVTDPTVAHLNTRQTFTRGITIDGTVDEPQLRVEAAPTQAGQIIQVVDANSANVLIMGASGALVSTIRDAGTTASAFPLTLVHATSGTPAAGFGTGLALQAQTSAAAPATVGQVAAEWADATTATRKGRLRLLVQDASTGREGLRVESDGSRANLGLLGASNFAGGSAVIAIVNCLTAPGTTPTGGGVLYVEAGSLKYKGSSGTVTILGPA